MWPWSGPQQRSPRSASLHAEEAVDAHYVPASTGAADLKNLPADG